MITDLLGLAAWLLADLAIGIFAFSCSMARLPTEVVPTSKTFAADLSTPDVVQPALLILQRFLPAHTPSLDKERASRTVLAIQMTSVRNLRMTTRLRPMTWVPARWWLGTTRQRWHQNCATTIAGNLLENGFSAGTAGTFVAQLFTKVVAALQGSSTLSSTDVLSFDPIIGRACSGMEWSLLASACEPLDSLPLSRTAMLLARVPAAVQIGPANATALRLCLLALVAYGCRCCPPTTAIDGDGRFAWRAVSRVTDLGTSMVASQSLPT